MNACLLCDAGAADAAFSRVRLWEDGQWRLSAVLRGAVAGFAHLEPVRHVPYVEDLDGDEAQSFGVVLARATAVLKQAAGAERVYAYVFGDRVPHFHVNLAPHVPGGPLRGGPGLLQDGAVELDAEAHARVADRARALLG